MSRRRTEKMQRHVGCPYDVGARHYQQMAWRSFHLVNHRNKNNVCLDDIRESPWRLPDHFSSSVLSCEYFWRCERVSDWSPLSIIPIICPLLNTNMPNKKMDDNNNNNNKNCTRKALLFEKKRARARRKLSFYRLFQRQSQSDGGRAVGRFADADGCGQWWLAIVIASHWTLNDLIGTRVNCFEPLLYL